MLPLKPLGQVSVSVSPQRGRMTWTSSLAVVVSVPVVTAAVPAAAVPVAAASEGGRQVQARILNDDNPDIADRPRPGHRDDVRGVPGNVLRIPNLFAVGVEAREMLRLRVGVAGGVGEARHRLASRRIAADGDEKAGAGRGARGRRGVGRGRNPTEVGAGGNGDAGDRHYVACTVSDSATRVSAVTLSTVNPSMSPAAIAVVQPVSVVSRDLSSR